MIKRNSTFNVNLRRIRRINFAHIVAVNICLIDDQLPEPDASLHLVLGILHFVDDKRKQTRQTNESTPQHLSTQHQKKMFQSSRDVYTADDSIGHFKLERYHMSAHRCIVVPTQHGHHQYGSDQPDGCCVECICLFVMDARQPLLRKKHLCRMMGAAVRAALSVYEHDGLWDAVDYLHSVLFHTVVKLIDGFRFMSAKERGICMYIYVCMRASVLTTIDRPLYTPIIRRPTSRHRH